MERITPESSKYGNCLDIETVNPRSGADMPVAFVHMGNSRDKNAAMNQFRKKFGRNYHTSAGQKDITLWVSKYDTFEEQQKKKMMYTVLQLMGDAYGSTSSAPK
eukprot:12408531-Karenia_brevis.AAC.1